MHGKSPSITTHPNTVQNTIKLIDLAITVELTSNFNAMTLKFSDKFDNPFSHVFIIGNVS